MPQIFQGLQYLSLSTCIHLICTANFSVLIGPFKGALTLTVTVTGYVEELHQSFLWLTHHRPHTQLFSGFDEQIKLSKAAF
jgi:hypothetical protein